MDQDRQKTATTTASRGRRGAKLVLCVEAVFFALFTLGTPFINLLNRSNPTAGYVLVFAALGTLSATIIVGLLIDFGAHERTKPNADIAGDKPSMS